MMHTTQECRIGDARDLLREMSDESVDTVVTSPPYWGLRDYQVGGQIGLEPTLEEYHDRLLEVTAECMRVLKPSGVMFWNHGDSYGGNQGRGAGKGNEHEQMVSQKNTAPKCLTMQNERLIMRMIDEQGWILRNRIIWHKPNGMPSSVQDRFSNKYEPVYMLTKQGKYWFDLDAVRVPHKCIDPKYKNYRPNKVQHFQERSRNQYDGKYLNMSNTPGDSYNPLGKNPGDVWHIPTQPYPESHFATFPTALIEPMIKAACPTEICPECGFIRERVVRQIEGVYDGPSHQFGGKSHGGMKSNVDAKQSPYYAAETIGWTSCDCNAGWIAGTVLDPFCGSGTVLEVCRLLNRNAIGMELNPEYSPLIMERSMAHTPPLTAYFGAELLEVS